MGCVMHRADAWEATTMQANCACLHSSIQTAHQEVARAGLALSVTVAAITHCRVEQWGKPGCGGPVAAFDVRAGTSWQLTAPGQRWRAGADACS